MPSQPAPPEGEFVFIITTPRDPTKIGLEAIYMVSWAEALMRSRVARDVFEDIVRRGFAYNFSVEGVPSSPWAELAPRTQREREEMLKQEMGGLVEGFTPTHPILQRTGKYRQSWVEKTDPDALSLTERPEANTLFMYIGSSDDRVPKLSSGFGASMAEAMAATGQAYSQSVWEELGVIPTHPWGNIPPRPVNELFEQYEGILGETGESFGKLLTEIATAKAKM